MSGLVPTEPPLNDVNKNIGDLKGQTDATENASLRGATHVDCVMHDSQV